MKSILRTAARRFWLLAALPTLVLLAPACKKNQISDEEQISNYISANKLSKAQRQPSGLYYVPVLVDSTKTQAQATAGRIVSVLYTGSLLDGSVFDASSRHPTQTANGPVIEPLSFVLGRRQVIAGWDEGIALMRKGEKGILLIPSALAYGSQGQSGIPANSVLRFDVTLTEVK